MIKPGLTMTAVALLPKGQTQCDTGLSELPVSQLAFEVSPDAITMLEVRRFAYDEIAKVFSVDPRHLRA